MLVIVSDLHLTDGTCGKSISASAFELFADRLEELAFNASWRADGRYRPVSEVNVLLLGDILDPLHSTLWLERSDGTPNPVRPWTDVHAPEFATTLAEITQDILRNNAGATAVLKELADGRSLRLPPADRSGRPARFFLRRARVRVNIYYMVGNHDWYYHLPGAEFEAIRTQVREALGLRNPPGPFPHEARELESLRELLARYQVYAQHGDLYDSFNYSREKGRNASSLGDAFAVEIINRFPLEVERRLKDDLPAGFIDSLRELVNVRPALATPLWISSQLDLNGVSEAAGRKLKDVWNELGREFLALPFVRAADRKFKLDAVDGLQVLLSLTERVSFKAIDALVVWVRKHLRADEITFSRFALQEEAFLNHEAQFIVYGHTHHHEVVPLDSSPAAPQPANQMYMNSGTWHSYFDLAIHKPEEEKFISYQVLTYLTFYRDGERGGRRFETWSGSFSD
jgi:UDP-2,3-diacylglucosamine pyrophosphatase LpxH